MSSVTSTASLATATPACSNLYDTPVDDAVCAMSNTGNYTELMFSCCKGADVVSYYSGCGLYCLATDQTVKDLSDCLYGQGAAWEDVFCRGNESATATGTAAEIPASASASVLSSVQATSTSKPQDNTKNDKNDKNAAATAQPRVLSILSLVVASLVISATLV